MGTSTYTKSEKEPETDSYKKDEDNVDLEDYDELSDVQDDTKDEESDNAEIDPGQTVISGKPKKKKNMYFDNEAVEALLDKYVKRGCVDVELRDEIMSHANELIRQIIRAHNFEHIFPGRDQSSFYELFQVAWMQIEKTLYKYNNAPGSPKLFNMWSQVAKTRILAYLKKEKRDKKNMPSYRDWTIRRYKTKSRSIEEFEEFLGELDSFCNYDEDFATLAKEMRKLWLSDDKPYDGLKAKLQRCSGKDINVINQFFKMIRLHRDEFSANVFDLRDFDAKDTDGYFFTDHDE